MQWSEERMLLKSIKARLDKIPGEKMIIKKADVEQFQHVMQFYHSVIDGISGSQKSVGWIKDIYPAPDYLRESIDHGELYVALEAGQIIAAMILNHRCNEGYREYRWPTDASDSEVTVIHALAVHPSHTGKGYGKKMVHFAIETARRNQQKVIRLDVLKGNVSAEMLYAGMGFQYLHTLPMFYEDTGMADFELYEYVL